MPKDLKEGNPEPASVNVFPSTLVVIASILVLMASLITRAATHESISAIEIIEIAIAIIVTCVSVLTLKRNEPRTGIHGSLIALAWAPMLICGAWCELHRPIVDGPVADALEYVLAAVAFIASILIGWKLPKKRVVLTRTVDSVLFSTSAGAIVVALVLAIVGATRSASRPDATGFVRTVPVVAEIGIGEHARFGGSLEISYRPASEQLLRRANVCHLFVNDVKDDGLVFFNACSSLQIRRDDALDLTLVEDHSGRQIRYRNTMVLTRSYFGSQHRGVYVSDVAGRLSAPKGWLVAACISPVIGALLFLNALVRRVRASRLKGEAAELFADGWIVVHDRRSPRTHVPSAASLPEGPVTVQVEEEKHVDEGSGYREAAAPLVITDVRAGTLEMQRTALRDRAQSLALAGGVIALLGALPLLIATMFGLVL